MSVAALASNPEVIKLALSEQKRMQKIALYTVLGIVGVILFVIFWKRFSRWFGKAAEVANIEAMQQSVNASNLTFPKNQYSLFADNLFSAMDGMGTDEESIYGVFRQMQTDDDVSQLIVAYGIRTVTDPRPWYSNKDLSLAQSIKDELDETEVKKINVILAGKGIKYRF